ncbi:MAG: hypothetical protein M3Q31_26870, partial [Actinomycetota bacterium]|nr:hypothetical protein [Actinomycetota bacterium]
GCRSRLRSRAYRAQVWSPRDQKTIRKTFATVAQAKAWRQESQQSQDETETHSASLVAAAGRRQVAPVCIRGARAVQVLGDDELGWRCAQQSWRCSGSR